MPEEKRGEEEEERKGIEKVRNRGREELGRLGIRGWITEG
jgi:hypothetical protein